MSRWIACLLLGLVVLVCTVWKADADAVATETEQTNAVFANWEHQPAEDAEDEKQDADETPATDDEESTEKEAAAKEKVEEDKKAAESDVEQKTDDTEEDANEEKQSTAKSTDGEEKDEKTDEKSDEKEKKKPKPHKVERKALKIDVKLDGVFVPEEMEEIAVRPETWTQFKVLEAVEHGTRVKKGDVLVRFDDEKIEERLAEEAIDQRLGELALMQAEEEFPHEEKLLELKYEEARRDHEQLLEDIEYYKNTDRPFMVRIANYRYNSAKEDLASQREELAQLKKMYAADELTEETEQIVLRRQEFEVATAELVLELQEAGRDYTLGVTLPRYDETYARQLEEVELKLEQVKTATEMGLTRARYELGKKREARAKSIERHAKLLGDRSLMEVRAPTDGIVYYGRCVKGKWSEVTSLSNKLRPFGTISVNSVMMTLVHQRPLHVETKLAEKELPDFKTGLEATIVPSGDDQLELTGKVTEILFVPDSGTKFKMQLDVDLADAPEWLVAGMTCKAKVTVYENDSALVIPADLVQTDEEDEKTKYVMVVDPDEEEPVRRNVKLGRSKDKLVEVLRGLEEGEEIVKEEKKDDSKDESK